MRRSPERRGNDERRGGVVHDLAEDDLAEAGFGDDAIDGGEHDYSPASILARNSGGSAASACFKFKAKSLMTVASREKNA